MEDEPNLQRAPSTETPEDKLDRMFRASHSTPSQPGTPGPRHFVRKLPEEDERLKHGLVEKRSHENSFWQVAALCATWAYCSNDATLGEQTTCTCIQLSVVHTARRPLALSPKSPSGAVDRRGRSA